MIKSHPYIAALLATLCTAFMSNVARAASIGTVITNHTGAVSSSMLIDGDLLLVYTDTSKAYNFTLPGTAQARVLAVGGGGAGGIATGRSTGSGGGGGAGGVLETNALIAAGTVSVQVGVGGAAATAIVAIVGEDGSASSVAVGGSVLVNALGGGGGGGKTAGNDGGSGGGGSKMAGGAGVAGQGCNGGASTVNKSSGGGGGAGADGESVTTAIGGAGGVGVSKDITGSAVTYGGGGGGAVYNTGTGGHGGLGGGGNGAGGDAAAMAGANGLGGGGGGGNDKFVNGKGGDGVVIIRISAMLDGPIVKPTDEPIDYDGELHTKIKEIPFAYTIDGTAAATDVGTYDFSVVLNEGFTWSDGTDDDVDITWEIKKSSNSITGLAIKDWKEGNTPSRPTCTYKIGEVEYLYSNAADGEYSAVQPTAPGTYYLKARIAGTANYDGASAGPVEFHILMAGTSPMPSLGRFVDIYCTNYTGTATLTNFVMLVKVREGTPNGFEYWQALSDGSDVRFCTPGGEPLAFECDQWDPSGESIFWVKIPEFNRDTRISMCWGKVIGGEVPQNTPTQTWSDYVGVWHMNGGSGNEKDATGHGLNGTPKGSKLTEMTSDANAPVGLGRVNQTTDGKFNRLSVPNYNAYIANQSVFTVSGWFKSTNATGYPRPLSRKNNYNESTGWEIQYNNGSKTQCDMRGSSDKQVTMDGPDVTADWVYLTYVFNGTNGTAYANGEQKKSGTIAAVVSRTDPMAIGNNANGSEQGWCGSYDEVRMYNGALQAEWIKADYEQMKGGGFGSFDIASKDKRATFENYWRVEPSLTPTVWDADGTGGVVSPGQPAAGTPEVTYRNCASGEALPVMPIAAGVYEVVFRVSGVEGYTDLEKVIQFRIAKHSPYNDADGAAGANGRVLLMNRDTGAVSVDYQGYYDNAARTATKGSFWEYVNTDGGNTGNLQLGTEFKYWTINYGKVLWHLVDCRHGNTFPTGSGTGTTGLLANQNYLPWSSTSRQITGTRAVTRATVGWCVMRNTTNAKVYSSCFDEGIGTIYFDAVNGWNDTSADDYKIAVSIATNCLDAAGMPVDLPPTDENIHQIIPAHIECETNWVSDVMVVTTNHIEATTNLYALADWKPVPMVSLKRDWSEANYQAGISHFVNEGQVYTNALNVTNGGGTNNFYRLYVPLDYKGAVRFKIERVSADSSYGIDARSFLVLDNIIVSYPAMRTELSSYGIFDATKSGKQILGQEAAWNVPFPSLSDEILVRAKPTYYLNSGNPSADPSKFVVAAKLNYCWRYLDQVTPVWKSVYLDQNDGFKAKEPLDLPGIPGDVEFYYELSLNAPYYEYYDYSGAGLGVAWSDDGGATTRSYTEEKASIINRATGAKQQSRGTDWFVRLREGSSDYECADLVVRRGAKDAAATETVIEMELTGDHIWRGYLKTLTNDVSDVYYRIRFRNRQTPGSETWEENETVYYTTFVGEGGVVSSIMDPVRGDEDWAVTKVDAATGYLMFQADDTTRSITMVHADYQNFNGWNDAKKTIFVGTSVEDGAKSGASPVQRELGENFDTWSPMEATDEGWTVPTLSDLSNLLGRKSYVTFASDTQNGWDIGQGMWVGKYYADSSGDAVNKGVAIQMEGQGRGFVQFINKDKSPRGLESISFNARLGQFVGFNDFSYFDGGSPKAMTNYTFSSRVAFDLKANKNFRGNASLSLVAYYRPGIGCYEARWEQLGGKWESGKCTGPRTKGENGKPAQRLCLYRWRATGSGAMKAKLLMAVTNNSWEIKSPTAISDQLQPLFISAETKSASNTEILIGVGREGWNAYPLKVNGNNICANSGFDGICYSDTSSDRLKAGAYGVLSANCEGVFGAPVYYSALPTRPGDFPVVPSGGGTVYGGKKIVLPDTTTQTACYDSIEAEDWMVTPGRMAYDGSSSTPGHKYLKAMPATQTLTISTSPVGKTEWTKVKDVTISGFGSAGVDNNFVEKLYTTKDCAVRIAVGGTVDDVRTDVVIDSVTLRQWRGDDYGNQSLQIPGWHDPTNYKDLTNFYFTTCWITKSLTDGMILMSAKRTEPGLPCSIVSPLFDGKYGRGIGLGMFAFSYRNAQENTRLLLQIATNVTYNTIGTLETLESSPDWITVTNFNFASAGDRDQGSRSCYIGMHDTPGVMRLVIDPSVVTNVSQAGWTDASKFGEIFITEVFCRDEPKLDSGCWWGWNVRTIGSDTAGADNEGRMYLPDLTTDPKKIGLSLALNNSITDMTRRDEEETYRQNKPFVQTPTFAGDVVGEISFRARKYLSSSSQPAAVMLYGSRTGSTGGDWVVLNDGKPFVISNSTYSTYSYKTDPGQSFRAFRLCVNGVDGVIGPGEVQPAGYAGPVRVMLDEIVVSEAVRARVAFRNVGAFRSSLRTRDAIKEPLPSVKEQPLCNEGWGVQCEVYAAQLPDDINFDIEPLVYLHYYVGDTPWGFENWGSDPKAKTVRLPMSVDSNLVYRSTYLGNNADSVVPMSTMPGEVVQYMLEVRYWQKGSAVAMTNYLNDAEWKRPDWYRPLDLNADYGKGVAFAAYNILDTVAPNWAWINEANIYGRYDGKWSNSESDAQFVEIAVPVEADITGWSVRLIGASVWDGTIVTNTIGRFGFNKLPGMKKDGGLYAASNMVFRVLGSPASDKRSGGRLDPDDGRLDGTWTFQNESDTFLYDGEIFATDPLGIQLVRASGIVEHEVICVGTNFYGSMPGLEEYYAPSNTVNFLNSNMRDARFIYVGEDSHAEGASLGVFTSHGESTNVWNNTMRMTPGRINQNQVISPDHPTPNGETILVYANIDSSVGHIVQTVGDVVETNASVTVFITRGSIGGTNITYRVDPWYELGSVTQNGKPTSFSPSASPKRTYVVNVGAGASNNVTVIAKAQPQASLIDQGLTPDNPYTPAVMDWLVRHKNADGGDWADQDADEVKPAKFLSLSGNVVTNLTLTEMYWLDMDPTVGDLALKAGMVKPSAPRIVEGYMGTSADTNVVMSVYMMITNLTEDTTSDWYGWAKPPYILRGLAPGETSWQYDNSSWGWTSVTFKVTGILANGHMSESIASDWIPLRWFVFHKDSFIPRGQPGEGTCEIEVRDPYSKRSPGYAAGWYSWKKKYGQAPVFFSWALDRRLQLISVEVLKQENLYDD